MSRPALLRLLDELGDEVCHTTICVSAETLVSNDCAHLLPDAEPERAHVSDVLSAATSARQPSDTGLAIFLTHTRTVVIRPPFPLDVDMRAAGFEPQPLHALFASRPVVGIVLLRLGRYAVAVLRGDRLLATKTDTRYVKNRHRKGGSSQRRFERSRERLVRELYDTTCRITRGLFEPYLRDIDHVMLGGEKGTLNGFVKRCRLMQDLEPKTLSRVLSVDRPNQKALESISYEVWKSRVTFF